jgi:hypothetical protein
MNWPFHFFPLQESRRRETSVWSRAVTSTAENNLKLSATRLDVVIERTRLYRGSFLEQSSYQAKVTRSGQSARLDWAEVFGERGSIWISADGDDPARIRQAHTAHEKPIDLHEWGNISASVSNPVPKPRFCIINELASSVGAEMQTIAQKL